MATLRIITAPQLDHRLGRNVVHDPRSRDHPHQPRSTPLYPADAPWRHRVYNPSPTPSQAIGCCSGVDQCVKANTVGNRVTGVVLGMKHAVALYHRATQLDPWPGEYPPDDTGSSGLAACKAAQQAGLITHYDWIFTGVDGVIAALRSKPVGVGTWWYEGMFEPDPRNKWIVRPTGAKAGGHQWTLIGYNPRTALLDGMCWWGPDFGAAGAFRIHRDDLGALLADDGDAHVTHRVGVSSSTA